MFQSLRTLLTGVVSVLLLQQGIDQVSSMTGDRTFLAQLRLDRPATAAPKYIPQSGGRPPRRTVGTGSRGCEANSAPVTLTLLVPGDHIGKTGLGHPAFSWHLSRSLDASILFTLVEPGKTKALMEQQINAPKAGIFTVQMPNALPELTIGKSYRWTVSLICNAKRPSSNIFAEARIERVALSTDLEQKLASAQSDQQKANLYAGAGLWYDALAALSAAHAANPGDASILADRLALLQQIGLTQVVQQESTRGGTSQSLPKRP